MARGRPIKTDVREKIASLLAQAGCAYGYEIYKMYKNIFEPTSLRNIYYNLKKGVSIGEFIIIDVKRESGEFTWGGESEHIYYGLGPYASIFNITDKQKDKINHLTKKSVEIDWLKEISDKIKIFNHDISEFLAKNDRMRYEDRRKTNELLKIRGAKLKDWVATKLEKEKGKELIIKIDELVKILI